MVILRTWHIAMLIVLATLGAVFYPGGEPGLTPALSILAIDIFGLLVARHFFQRLDVARKGATKKRRTKKSGWIPGAPETGESIEAGQPKREIPISALPLGQSLVHAVGMGFGVSAAIVGAYVAYY